MPKVVALPLPAPVVQILNTLVRAPADRLDPAIGAALGQVCAHAGALRGWMILRGDEGRPDVRHHWAAGPDQTWTCPDAGVSADLFALWSEALAAGQPFRSSGTPCEGAILDTFGAVELRVVPLVEAGHLLGLVMLDVPAADAGSGIALDDLLSATAGIMAAALARQATEARREHGSDQMDAILAALPDLLFEIDAAGCYTGFVAGPEHLMAAPPSEMIGRRLEDVLPDQVGAIARSAFDQVIATGHVGGLRYRLELGQETRWFELSGARKDADHPDAPPGAIFLVRDVTEDAALRDQLARLGKIVETMSNLVVLVDLDQRIQWVNAAFTAQTGWSLSACRGHLLSQLLHCPDSDAAVARALARATDRREAFRGETLRQGRDGTRYWVDLTMVPLFDADGTANGFVFVETVMTRQKEQEARLEALASTEAAARTRLANALAALPDGVVVLDAEYRVVVVNETYRRMLPQLSDLTVEGTHLSDLLRAGLRAGVFLAGGTPEAQEAWIETRLADYHKPHHTEEVQLADGRWIRRISNRTADGGCIVVGIDVTAGHNQLAALDEANLELTRALAERDETERRLSGIIEGADVGTWEWNLVNGLLRVGGYWAEMLGLQDDLGEVFPVQVFRDLVHPDDLVELDSTRDHDLLNPEALIEREFRMRHKNGRWIGILSRSRVTTRAPGGAPLIVSGVNLDVSDSKRLQTELEAGRTFLEQVMQTSTAATIVTDAEGNLVYFNHEAERILRLNSDRAIGNLYIDPSYVMEHLDGTPLDRADMPCQRAQAAPGPARNILFAVRWPDGVRRILSANSAQLRQEDGQIRVVVSFADVTDETATTERLEDARQRAEEASRTKSVFLANMSHEIRTPLNGVLGMTEVLESILTEPEHKRIASTIRTSGESLLMILNSILDMSKIEAGKMVLDLVPFRPTDIVRHSEAVFAVQAEEKGLDFEVLISAGGDRAVLGDPHRIQQILNNLLHNAFKFTEDGEVRLKLSCKPGKPMTVEVSDTGIGMTEAQLARVFDSFEQADGSITRRFGGTGLGLSIVKQLVGLMGGTLDLQSTSGVGTTARIELPLQDAGTLVPKQESLPDLGSDSPWLAGRKLLIADDNATNRLVLCEMLLRSGADITTAENGEQVVAAWDALHQQGEAFDLLLLDITMPVLDGLSALVEIRRREVRANMIAVPAIAVTANAMPNQVADYIIGGFDSHLAKPFKHKDLLQAVRALIRG